MVDRVAFIDGKPVPCILLPSQVSVLFPAGLAGLQETSGDRAHVFPDADGVFRLLEGASYSLAMRGAMSWPVRTVSPASQQEPKLWAPATACVKEEQNSFRSCGPDLFIPKQNSRETMQPPSPRDATFGSQNGDLHYNIGKSSSMLEDDVARPTTDYSVDLSTCSQQPRSTERTGKLIQDRVHEYVFLPMIAIRIIDTLEFQRLRSLKQLGTSVFLYPGATHTRFEHSIGVAHLASEMVLHIARHQPEINITPADIISVTIAGLCHDIGHGPFSHLFEHVVNRIREGKRAYRPWHHEQMSIRLLRRILKRLDLASYGLTNEDAIFMELCITGLPPKAQWPTNIGRPPRKRCLLDIVANKRSGLDVDKLDYFLRDSLGCYGRAAVDVHIPRLMKACKVMSFEDEFQICFEEKMALSLGDIFNVRAKLHKHVYQHRIVKVTDHMVADALYEADPYFKVRGSGGRLISMSECVEDEEGFCQLGDWVFNAIASSGDPNLAKAQAIIKRINERDLYSVVGMALFARYQKRVTEQSIQEEILSYCISNEESPELRQAIEATLIVSFINITFGSVDEQGAPDDPINHITFYNPKNMEFGAFKLPRTRMSPLFSPSEYGEQLVLVMVRDKSLLDYVIGGFDAWQERNVRHLGVAVPTHNMRKEESPSKGSANARRMGDGSTNNNNYNNISNGVEVYPTVFPLYGMLRQSDTVIPDLQKQQQQQQREREKRESNEKGGSKSTRSSIGKFESSQQQQQQQQQQQEQQFIEDSNIELDENRDEGSGFEESKLKRFRKSD